MIEAPPADVDRRKRLLRIVQIGVSLIVVLVIFVGILPKIADYSAVGAMITSLTWYKVMALLAATIFATAAFWPQLMAALPGLTVGQAAVANQASTTIANTLPGGGMIAVGTSYAMFRSWGFPDSAIALSILITFVWNVFTKLALPVVALVILATVGKGSIGLLVASAVGLAILAAGIGSFTMMHRREGLPGQIGSVVGSVASFCRKLVRKPPVAGWGEKADRLRTEARRLVAARWLPLTVSTVVSHLGVYLVLVLAVRDVGISAREVTWPQVLGVFAVVRLLSALPITPGGLGIVDLGYIGGLVLAGRHHTDVPLAVFQAQVTAAVLVFRALTYGLQIPLGGVAYLIWGRKKSWRTAPPVWKGLDRARAANPESASPWLRCRAEVVRWIHSQDFLDFYRSRWTAPMLARLRSSTVSCSASGTGRDMSPPPQGNPIRPGRTGWCCRAPTGRPGSRSNRWRSSPGRRGRRDRSRSSFTWISWCPRRRISRLSTNEPWRSEPRSFRTASTIPRSRCVCTPTPRDIRSASSWASSPAD